MYWIKLTGIAYEEKIYINSPQPAWNRNPNKKLHQFWSQNETLKMLKTSIKNFKKIQCERFFYIWYNHRPRLQK